VKQASKARAEAAEEPPAEQQTLADREAATAAEWTWRLIRRVHLGTRKPSNWIQLVKFGIVGATGYFVNLAVFAVLVEALDLHHIPAAVGAFCVAVMNNFFWNRHWTFRATHGHAGFQAARFFAVSLAALGVNLVVLALLVDIAGAPELPSQALAVALAMPFNFVGNKLWTFGGR
jgi:dolichol-phosphate mannosyltransferase